MPHSSRPLSLPQRSPTWRSIGVRVLSIDPFAVNVLTKRHSYYTPCTIPANTYAGQGEAAQTVGVRAVVVARNDMPEDQVKSIMQLLFNGQIPFAEKLRARATHP